MSQTDERLEEMQTPAEKPFAECVYVGKEDEGSGPRYMGTKKCPLGANNEYRWQCKAFYDCVDAYILKRLREKYLPLRLLRELRCVVNGMNDCEYGYSDYMLLLWIGQASTANGYAFGRKAVDRAIRESNVREDADPVTEAADIRLAFGVFGREGMSRRENRPCRANQGG